MNKRRKRNYFIHKSAEVSKDAQIGYQTKVWNDVQIRENVTIGNQCIIGKGVYIDKGIKVGDKVKIQNYSSIYYKTIIESGVFIGPYCVITNDKYPRAINPDGSIKTESNWEMGFTVLRKGASIGANVIILPNLEIGMFSMVGAGSVVTANVKPHTLVYGNPAKIKGYICLCGKVISQGSRKPKILRCKKHRNVNFVILRVPR